MLVKGAPVKNHYVYGMYDQLHPYEMLDAIGHTTKNMEVNLNWLRKWGIPNPIKEDRRVWSFTPT